MKDIFNWIVVSSANSEKVSLFVKGLVIAGAFFGIDAAVIGQLGNELAHLAVLVGAVVASAASAYGLIRKVYLTVIAKYS